MADYIQYEGEYPELENCPDLFALGQSPTPSILYSQEDNGYPELNGLPDAIEFNLPTPFLLYRQEESYPYLDYPDAIEFMEPTPYILYKQKEEYPYLDYPDAFELWTNPIPFIMRTVNEEDVRKYIIIVKEHKQKFINIRNLKSVKN